MNLPPAFEKRMRETLGTDFENFEKSLSGPLPVSIRVNPRKRNSLVGLQPIPWSRYGYYLPERPIFTLDPHFHGGAYYVQEASSMFLEKAVEQALDLRAPLRVLDLCAAPGGKSTHLISLLSEDSLLVSNEVIRSRATILAENSQKWGFANTVVTNSDPQNFQQLSGFFDAIVVDAPCSGEGLFRKEPEAMREWSEENVHLCSLRQRRIVSDVWPALREGGILIYSTCTYNAEENERNLQWLAENNDIDFIELTNLPAGVEEIKNNNTVGYRLYPHRINGEGFFLAVIRKKEKSERMDTRSRKSVRQKLSTAEAKDWLVGDFHFTQQNDLLIAWPSLFTESIELLQTAVTVINKGVAVATVKNTKLVPEHALALSVHLNKNLFHQLSVTKETALQYLRKDTFPPPDAQKGFALIAYEGTLLGWVNRLGNRLNNLYPSNWRIKMGHSGPT